MSRTDALRASLARVESPGITTLSDRWPIFWERGEGARIWDVDGREYVDLTAAFGVAALGHGSPVIADAVSAQARRLLHGMGDVHPPAQKVALLERLAALAPGGLTIGALGLNGADAVETALKCAALVTGKPGVIAFEGSYHGVFGTALEVTSRRDFRDPFAARSACRTTFVPFPTTAVDAVTVLADLDRKLGMRSSGLLPTGALIVEPIQGRGGIVVPPAGFLGGLRELCDRHGLFLIVDEILTGFGRTGTLFAIDAPGFEVRPDLLCLGKALAGGMPLSVCLGHEGSLGRWPKAQGEALHTATFLGHPGSCAAAIASIDAIILQRLPERAAALGALAARRLEAIPGGRVRGERDPALGPSRVRGERDPALGPSRVRGERDPALGPSRVRGRGLLLGVELASGAHAVRAMERALELGVIVLVEGPESQVVAVMPPLVIEEEELLAALDIVEASIAETA